MGSCCSAPSSSDSYFRCSQKLHCFPSMSYDDDDDLISRPSSNTASPVSILHGPHSFAANFLHRFCLRAELSWGEFGVTQRCSDATTGEVLACKSISKRRLCTTSTSPMSDGNRDHARSTAAPQHRAAKGGVRGWGGHPPRDGDL